MYEDVIKEFERVVKEVGSKPSHETHNELLGRCMTVELTVNNAGYCHLSIRSSFDPVFMSYDISLFSVV